MKKAFTQTMKLLTDLLKKKIRFSLVNAVGILFFAGTLLITASLTSLIKNKEELLLNPSVHINLTYIKPFTSLAGFNWKFSKENKRKTKEVKQHFLALPITFYKTTF